MHDAETIPSREEVKTSYDALVNKTHQPDTRVRSIPMHVFAKDGISIVSRLLEEMNTASCSDAETNKSSLCYDKDIPLFTFSHESRLLTECFPFALPGGVLADMLPCASGQLCVGMHPDIPGHKECCGGIILRGVLTPEELTTFEHTGRNPDEKRLCVLCARKVVSEAYFETRDTKYESLLNGVCFNFYGNLRGCRDGYAVEHTIPIGKSTSWDGLIAPVACSSFSKMRIVRKHGVWTVDQKKLSHEYPNDMSSGEKQDLRVFR